MEIELASFDFLQHLIGPKSGSGTAATPYYLEEADWVAYSGTAIRTFSMEVASLDNAGGTNDVETITGCVLNKASFNLNLGATLKCTVEGFGKTVTSGTSATAYTPDTTKVWIFAQGNFKWNGSTVARVTSATINVDNGFDQELGAQIGSRVIEAAEAGLRKYDWVVTVKMQSAIATTLRDHFYGQANSPLIAMASAEPTFYDLIFDLSEGAGSGNRNAQIKLSNCAINDISKPISLGANLVELTINGTAKAATTDTVNKFVKYWTI